jgi:very-short-patch-repair endonuclease
MTLRKELTKQVFNLSRYKNRRSELRTNMTESETLFWQAVRGKQLGVKFRRQHGIGHYIVDFYCPELCLVVELDGSGHFTPEGIDYDRVRDTYLTSLGLRILRFGNNEVTQNLVDVLEQVMMHNPTQIAGIDPIQTQIAGIDPTQTLPLPGEGFFAPPPDKGEAGRGSNALEVNYVA